MASCAGEFAWRLPSWGVQTHQTSVKKTVQAVERTWSAAKRWAK